MTANEMYIRVINDLQAIGAQRSRKYAPEQIELELNTEIESFVNLAIREDGRGFYSVEEQYFDAVQPLIRDKWLPVYTDGGLFYSDLNINYNRILDMGVKKSVSCRAVINTDYQAKTITKLVGKPVAGSLTGGKYFTNVVFTVNGTVQYTRTTGGYTTNDVQLLITELIQNVPGLKWEDSIGYSKPGHLIYRTDAAFGIVTLLIDTTTVTFTVGSSISMNEVTLITAADSTIPARRLRQNNVSEVSSTAYYKPSSIEIPVTIQADVVNLLTPKNLIVSRLYVNYIRTPRKLSLSLNIGCDLSPSIHGIICDRTVQRIRERIGDPKLQTGIALEKQ